MATRRGCAALVARVLAAVVVVVLAEANPATARADESVMHQVRYTVTADQPLQVDIYYRDVDPLSWAEYSHNPYQFSPKDEASLAPGTPWVRDVALVDPERWATVAISRVSIRSEGTVRCELTVDGVVVDTADGPDGALCSLRQW